VVKETYFTLSKMGNHNICMFCKMVTICRAYKQQLLRVLNPEAFLDVVSWTWELQEHQISSLLDWET